MRDATSRGRRPVCRARSDVRAARLADRVDENVATARISVPPAVAGDEMVVQSGIGGSLSHRAAAGAAQERRRGTSTNRAPPLSSYGERQMGDDPLAQGGVPFDDRTG